MFLAMGCTPKPPKKERAVPRRKMDRPPIPAAAVPEMKGATGADRYYGLIDHVAEHSDMELDDVKTAVAKWLLDMDLLPSKLDDDATWRRVREIATVHDWKATVTA